MAIFSAIKTFLGDGFASKVMDFVRDRWPANMSEEQKAQMEILVREVTHRQEVELLEIASKSEAEFNQRIKDLEGTAADLKSIPIFGTLVIFLRGTQRPIWGFFTLYMDFIWFTTDTMTWSQQQNTAAIIINIIVLTFLFGERTILNLSPLIERVFGNPKGDV